MGLNIGLYSVGQKVTDGDYDFFYERQRHPVWDSARRSCDTDFRCDNDFTPIEPGENLHRPTDLGAVRQWVARQPDWVQERFGPVLDEMEADPSLHFLWSM